MLVPIRDQPLQGIFGAVWGFAAIVGPLLGGLLVRVLSWRWVFYVNVPFGLLSAVLLVVFFKERVRPPAKRYLDVLGAALLSGAIVAVLLGASGIWPGIALPIALVLGAAFVRVQRRAPDPLFPLVLLKNRAIAIGSVSGALLGAVMLATLTFVPLFVQAFQKVFAL